MFAPLVGCSESKTMDAQIQPADLGPADAEDAGEPTLDAGETPDLGPADTGETDAGTEVSLTLGTSFFDSISVPGEVDIFSFEAQEGQFARFRTETSELAGVRTDPVLQLFDSEMNLVAESDDATPRRSVDSELLYRFPYTGRYFVSIQEWSSWDPRSNEAIGGANYRYRFISQVLDDSIPGVTLHEETGDESVPKLVEGGELETLVLGHFDSATDRDDFRIAPWPSLGSYALILSLPSGVNGNGSTTAGGVMRLSYVDTPTIAAEIDLSEGYTELNLPSRPSEMLLSIQHPGGELGSNDFYVLRRIEFGRYDPEPNEPTNDDPSGAAILPNAFGAFIGALPEGDVDHIGLAAPLGYTLLLACDGSSVGSGVVDLRMALLGPDLIEVDSTVDNSPASARLTAQTTTTAPYYVRLEKSGQRPDVEINNYYCVLRALAP